MYIDSWGTEIFILVLNEVGSKVVEVVKYTLGYSKDLHKFLILDYMKFN